jgi:hypothetical protein
MKSSSATAEQAMTYMRIDVVKCPCGFELRVIVSNGCYVARPERQQWEKLCLDRPRAVNPMNCRQLQAAQRGEFRRRISN